MSTRAEKIREYALRANAKLMAMALGISEREQIIIKTGFADRSLLDKAREFHRDAEEHVRYIGELLKLYD